MRLIEFAFKSNKNFTIALMDLDDISTIEQHTKTSCYLLMKDGRKYLLPGTFRALTNRFTYGFGKIIEPHQDAILRPSVIFYHQPDKAEQDNVFLDEYQFKAFKSAIGTK